MNIASTLSAASVQLHLSARSLVFPTCSFKDKEVQRDMKMVSYDVVDKKGKPYVQVEVGGEKKTFSPEEISAMILGKMKETAGIAFAGK